MNLETIKYDEKGLIPAIIQDAGTGEVLTLAYMNQESLKLSSKKVKRFSSAVRAMNYGIKGRPAAIPRKSSK